MKLYLVQHGQNNPEAMDPDKNLSDKGRRDAEAVAQFLKSAAVFVDEIFHSGKPRALQTAEILSGGVQLKKNLIPKKSINSMDPVEPLFKEIEARHIDLMVVGHMPFMGKLASALLSGLEQTDILAFQQGSVACLEKFGHKWMVKWMITPELLEST